MSYTYFALSVLEEVKTLLTRRLRLKKNIKRDKHYDKKVPNTMLPPYSVFIPAYNEEKRIKKCLISVLQSTYLPKRVILVDDASKDKTFETAIDTIYSNVEHILEDKLINETNDKDISLIKIIKGVCRGHQVEFVLIKNNVNRGKTYNMNKVVIDMGLIETPVFLVVDADSFVDIEHTERLLRKAVEIGMDKLAAIYGFIIPLVDKQGVISRIIKDGLEIAYRAGYLIFRKGSNMLGFHYGVSGGTVIYNTKIYREFPRDTRTTGDVLTAWIMQANGYRVYAELSALRYAYEPETIVKLLKQRIRWAMGPYQTTLLVGKYVVKRLLERKDWRKLIGAIYTILYYVVLSTKYNLFYLLLPILYFSGLIPQLILVKFYVFDMTAFLVSFIFATLYLRRKYGYFKHETLVSFSRKYIAFYLLVRPLYATSILIALTLFIKDLFTRKYEKWYYKH